MHVSWKLSFACALIVSTSPLYCRAQSAGSGSQVITMPQYSVAVEDGSPPQVKVAHDHQVVFQMPVVAGLPSSTAEERLSDVTYSMQKHGDDAYELNVTAKSSLWSKRSFRWRFFPDHLEFQQFANGKGKLGRCYFFSNGVSNRWGNGTTAGYLWATTVYADRYFAPNPNHANQYEFTSAMPQTLGFSLDKKSGSDEDFRPERMTGIFAPPPLFLAFHLNGTWTSVGLGATPGDYQFPALEYSGSRYAGASFYVDYMGYRSVDGDFASPTIAMHFAYNPLDALETYTAWLTKSGFATAHTFPDVLWHHMPIFCGWAEQTIETVPIGGAPNKLATRVNYEKWVGELEGRGLPFGTIVIDDKWQAAYGTFDVDQQKWPDLKGFIATQHAKGRHVLLWVPVADPDGLPASLCVNYEGKCRIADIGKPEYEAYLRSKIQHLVKDMGVDGFKVDWVNDPAAPGLDLTGPATGIEFVRRFQSILYTETHKWKPDAMVETQTSNALFRESSDVLRLNDIWYASRNVPEMMRVRGRIANISGWPVVDTDNASSTTLKNWWEYMLAQPTIGVPALYFVTRTEATQESPSPEDWKYLASIWKQYIARLQSGVPPAADLH